MYCSKYIDSPLENSELNPNQVIEMKNQSLKKKAGRVLGLSERLVASESCNGIGSPSSRIGTGVTDVMGNMKKEKAIFAGITPKEKIQIAMEQLRSKINREDFTISGYHAKRKMDAAAAGVVAVK